MKAVNRTTMFITNTIDNEIDELLAVLDTDIQNIRQSLSRLNELRKLLIKRDDFAMSKLLSAIRAEADSYAANEYKRQSIRKALAESLGCEIGQVTLSGLQAILPGRQKAQIASKKAELTALVNKLKKQHSSTAMLLLDFARFNSQLLRSIFDLDKTCSVTYRRDGATNRQADKAFLSLHY